MRKQLPTLGGGVLLGILATLAFVRTEESGIFEPGETTRDIADVPTMPEVAAKKHREEQYESLLTIEQVLALPTEFARSEALHVLAGRSDSGAVQGLIFEANRIADDFEQRALLNVLFYRLAELDPQSALALSRMEEFRGTRTLEQRVWQAWGRKDLDDALFAAKTQPSSVRQDFAAQSFYAAFGYMGNETTDRIQAELGIEPDRSTRGRYLYDLADTSPAEAVAFINSLERGNRQREYVSWLAHHLSQRDPTTALRYADLFLSPADREAFAATVNSNIARQDPRAALERVLAGGADAQTNNQIYSAARELATTDLEALKQYFEQARSEQPREALGSALASEMARKNPTEALAWARENDRGTYPRMEMSVLRAIAETDPQLAIKEALISSKGERHSMHLTTVISRIAGRNPRDAIVYLDDIPNKEQRLEAGQRLADMWMRTDPDAAVGWILTQDEETATQLMTRAGYRLVENDVDAAMRILPRLSDTQQGEMRGRIARQLALTRSADDANVFIRQFQGEPGFDRLQASVVTGVAESDPRTAMQLAEQIQDPGARDSAYRNIIGEHARDNPAEAVRWLASVGDDRQRGAAAGQIAAAWASQDPVAATRWVRSLPPGTTRDDAIMNMVQGSRELSDEQMDLIATIENQEKRGQAKLRHVYSLMNTDPARAREFLNDPDIPLLQRQRLEDRMNQY